MRRFVEGIDTNGGQILTAYVLLLTGALFVKLGIMDADIIAFALGLMGRSMGGTTGRIAARDTQTLSSTVSTTTSVLPSVDATEKK